MLEQDGSLIRLCHCKKRQKHIKRMPDDRGRNGSDTAVNQGMPRTTGYH